MKVLLALSAIACASVVYADYAVQILNNDGSKKHTFKTPNNIRPCICLASTQTNTIGGMNGGNIKLFWSNDCTGRYNVLGSNSGITGAQWVNSMSFGPSGSSLSPGTCPNWYNM
ncbi:hypothetical protein BGZ73_007763 [Actinomortierella ambigua]|nr:hypothetical protein BGZ73_007763 [Actinomortierella ambigua]